MVLAVSGPPLQLPGGPRRGIYLLLAGVFFSLAMLGVALPVLPATPFLLLTSYCLVRSSPALDARLRASRTFGPLLENWRRHRGVTRRVKRTALVASPITIAASAFLGDLKPPALIALLALGAVGMIVVARLPVVDP